MSSFQLNISFSTAVYFQQLCALKTNKFPELRITSVDFLVPVDVRYILQAGLYLLDDGISMWDILENPDKLSKQLAEQKPFWEPGKNVSGSGWKSV